MSSRKDAMDVITNALGQNGVSIVDGVEAMLILTATALAQNAYDKKLTNVGLDVGVKVFGAMYRAAMQELIARDAQNN